MAGNKRELHLNAGAFRKDGKLVANHQDAVALLAYCWFGILLPTDEAALKAQMAMERDREFEHGLRVPIRNLLGFYKEVPTSAPLRCIPC